MPVIDAHGHGCRVVWSTDVKSAALPRLSVADGRIYTVTVSDPTDPICVNTLAAYHYAVLNSATAPLFALVS
ncbi:MAG: hypothetical protein HOY79_37500 [Streptomyces sp.]|nr:hypothetical protein [Streptomyces sp.]